MKKLFAGILALTLLTGLIGCNSKPSEDNPSETTTTVAEIPAPQATEETATATITTTVEETTIGTNVGNIVTVPETTSVQTTAIPQTTTVPQTTAPITTTAPVTTTAVVSDTKAPAEKSESDSKIISVANDFLKVFVSQKYTLDGAFIEDGKTNDAFMAIDANKGCMYMKMSEQDITAAMLLNKSGMYMILDSEKKYMAFPAGEEMPELTTPEFTDDKFYKMFIDMALNEHARVVRNTNFNGKNCDCVEYFDDGKTVFSVYVSDGKAVGLNDFGGEESMIIKSISPIVDEKLFEVPAGYSEMTLG